MNSSFAKYLQFKSTMHISCTYLLLLSIWAQVVVVECFRNSQNENDIDYENSHRMKCLVLSKDEVYVEFLFNSFNKLGAF